MTAPRLVLASCSAIRAAILKNAGIDFRTEKPAVDEEALKRERAGGDLEDLAMALAEAKAHAVISPGAFVLGSDQILEFEGRAFDKAKTMAGARERLIALEGRTHTLINAAAIAKDGEIVYRHLARPTLRMRAFTAKDIDAYLEKAGDEVLASVGCYQVEGLGAGLFESIEGDYFAVLGLSLFPLIGFLRSHGLGPF